LQATTKREPFCATLEKNQDNFYWTEIWRLTKLSSKVGWLVVYHKKVAIKAGQTL